MKVNKSQSVLFILYLLLMNGYIDKQIVMNEVEISDLDFYRYIQEIKAFCANFNVGIEIKFSRKDHRYYIKK